MLKSLMIFSLTLWSFFMAAQDFKIDGTINGLNAENVYLMRVMGQNRSIVDTAFADNQGSFTFDLGENTEPGLYAVVFGKTQMVELIVNGENIRFVYGGPGNSPVQIIESVENLIYYDYLFLKTYNQYKMELLEPLLQQYPDDDPFYTEILKEYNRLGQEIEDRVQVLTTENPNTLAAHFILVDSPLLTDPTQPENKRKDFQKTHYFDKTDFSDTLLMRSNILTSKIIAYLSLYQEPNQTQEQMENNLLVAVDTILEKAVVDQQVYEFVVAFLVDGFEAVGFEKGLEYLATHNQLEQFCENTERKAELENKMELIKKLAIGKTAPDFTATTLSGEEVRLSEIKAEKTLLVFWASWCPHCDEILPEIKKMYDPLNTSGLQIVGISVDEFSEDAQKAVAEGDYNWINIAAGKGWDGPVVLEYGIAATPTIFVLDENKTIVAKPLNIRDLKMALD